MEFYKCVRLLKIKTKRSIILPEKLVSSFQVMDIRAADTNGVEKLIEMLFCSHPRLEVFA